MAGDRELYFTTCWGLLGWGAIGVSGNITGVIRMYEVPSVSDMEGMGEMGVDGRRGKDDDTLVLGE